MGFGEHSVRLRSPLPIDYINQSTHVLSSPDLGSLPSKIVGTSAPCLRPRQSSSGCSRTHLLILKMLNIHKSWNETPSLCLLPIFPPHDNHGPFVSCCFVFPSRGCINPICTTFHKPNHSRPHQHHTIHRKLTILNILSTVSLGCAPTPNQYFVLTTSNLISLNFFSLYKTASPVFWSINVSPVEGSVANSGVEAEASGICGVGLYVPSTSIGLESRAVRACVRTML